MKVTWYSGMLELVIQLVTVLGIYGSTDIAACLWTGLSSGLLLRCVIAALFNLKQDTHQQMYRIVKENYNC